MDAYLQRIATYFGFPRLVFRLNEDSRKRIMRVSILPAAVFAGTLINVSLQIKFRDAWPEMPEFWQRVAITSDVAQELVPLAVAVVFAFGLRPWSRAEGSWMFLIGAALAAVSLGLGLSAALMYALLGLEDALHLYAYVWVYTAHVAGFLAVGYFFVAYRAMATGQPVTPSRRSPMSGHRPLIPRARRSRTR